MDTIGPQILLQVFLIALNAFFAATEIAVISLNAAKLRKMMEDGDKKAGKMLKMVEEPSRLSVHHPDRHYPGRIFGKRLCGGELLRSAGPVDYTGPGLYRYFDEHTKYAFSGADYNCPLLLYPHFRRIGPQTYRHGKNRWLWQKSPAALSVRLQRSCVRLSGFCPPLQTLFFGSCV